MKMWGVKFIKNGLIKKEDYTISELSTTNISALLSLLHGKNDSICKLFNKEIKVNIVNLKQLNKMMCDKLETHNVDAITTTVDIAFLNKQILHFKSWQEFEDYDFQAVNSSTKSVFIQWDFFIRVDGYEIPQRHTVNIRIASSPQPSDMFKVLLSGGFDESHDIDIQGSTMICKVDFINNTLAEELVNIAAKWNDLCESSVHEKGKFLQFLYLNRSKIANIVEISTILLICSTIALLTKLTGVFSFSANNITVFWFLMLFSLPLFCAIKDVSRLFGKHIFNRLGEVMQIHIFNISHGDVKSNERIKKDSNCKKECILFVIDLLLSIIISVVFFALEK